MEHSNSPSIATPFGQTCFFPLGTYDPQQGSCTLELTIPDGVDNYIGTVHGGWLATVIDEAYGQLASFQYGLASGGTVQLNVSYKKPARLGMQITVRAWCVQEKATGCVFRATVHNGASLLAESQTEWQFRPKFLLALESLLLPVGTHLVRGGVPCTIIKVYRRTDPAFLVISTGYGRTACCPYVVRNEKTGEVYSITAQEAEACKVS